uniref:Uncharacterized protein n=1 Tax=Ciona savignyi TaxID=51511 RepID=H2ZKI3_CIOSA
MESISTHEPLLQHSQGEKDFGSIKQTNGQHKNPNETAAKDEMPGQGGNSEKYNTWVRPVIAEFFGQLIFAFLHCSSVNTMKSISPTPNPLIPAVSDGFVVAILVITIGHISGAHVNFAVTTAAFIGGGIKLPMALLYLVAQLLGSLTGAGLAYVSSGGAFGQFGLGAGVGVGQGVLMEVVLTSLLTLSVLLAAVELNSTNAAFAIGFSILIDILAGFNISGACMNPTLSFGPAVVSGSWNNYWVYWVGPLVGALVSGTLFRIFLGGPARLIFKQDQSQENNESSMEKASTLDTVTNSRM